MADIGQRPIALVVAHPDDEVLWFSSVLPAAEAVIFCFEAVPSRPDWSAGRSAVVDHYPLPGVRSLRLIESEAFNAANWNDPRETDYGLEVRPMPNALPGIDVSRYEQNFHRLREALRQHLAGSGCVYTHNPWGEYGHEEHVQVYRAVKSLQRDLGFELRFGNYCSNKSSRLMMRYVGGFDAPYATHPTNAALGERLAALYKEHGCWTWFDDYRWFTHECFMSDAALPAASPAGHIFPLNYIKIAETHVAQSRAARAAATVRTALAGWRITAR